MSAPTVAVEWLLARAAVRATGLLHVVSRRDSGALNPVCGANPIRSREIETHAHLADVAQLCDGCGAMAASIGGTVRDGVALLLGLSASATTARLLEIPVDAIRARRDHARQSPGDDLEALVASVVERGIVAPLVVRRHGRGYEVIDGARRLYAAHVAGLSTVPAIVRDASDVDALVDGLVANLHRADLNPIEQARAYEHLLEVLACSKAELGRRLGISREQVSNTVRLLALPEEDRARVAAGEVSAEGGRALLRGTRAAPDPQLAAIADLLGQALEAKVVLRTRGATTEIVLRVPTADRDRVLAQLSPAA